MPHNFPLTNRSPSAPHRRQAKLVLVLNRALGEKRCAVAVYQGCTPRADSISSGKKTFLKVGVLCIAARSWQNLLSAWRWHMTEWVRTSDGAAATERFKGCISRKNIFETRLNSLALPVIRLHLELTNLSNHFHWFLIFHHACSPD